MDLATAEKTDVEDKQRKIRQTKEKEKMEHQTRFFECTKEDVWVFKNEAYH